ncbi:hypothetical protein BG011_007209 [Mortierella polycephala]|uniref:Uncharacterized protein n=1 Tax=Mortierella polycephala TaxID=41804 RepID=A0A9P6TZ09_9FUNG|nr:hypothetical protein BG011_007209 [Mortierella polycephala]
MVLNFSDEETAWIQEVSDRSPGTYFDTFGIEDKQRGHLRYARLLEVADLRDNLRRQLSDEFSIWKIDKAPRFWLNRRARLASINTATTLIEGSEPYAEEAILHNAAIVRDTLDMRGSVSISGSGVVTTSQADVNLIDEANEDSEATVTAAPEPADSFEVDEDERAELLANIDQARHVDCDEWKFEDNCLACLFQDYQRVCVQALHEKIIKKSEIADVMAITGVFAPFIPTVRMTEVFGRRTLEKLLEPVRFPDPMIDDAAVVKAVRLCINNDKDKSSEALRGLDRKIRIMFEIFPNTSSEVQRKQGLKPDRPDVVLKARDQEVFYGEVTGLSQENSDWKNKWDLFRLSRFGKAFLDNGNDFAPLLQVVYTNGTYMRMSVKLRGIYLLEEVGSFIIPTTIPMVPALLVTLPTLFAAERDLKRILAGDLNHRKRSWGYKDILNAKKRLV